LCHHFFGGNYMKNIGKTPLLRARNIEKHLGFKRLYIKLEGANPSGSKHDRLAQKIVYSAVAKDVSSIVADGSKPFLKALAFYTSKYDIQCHFFQFRNQKWKSKLGNHIELIDYKKKNRPSGYSFYRKFEDQYDFMAIEGMNHQGLAHLAYMEVGTEIIQKMKSPADSVFFTHQEDYQNSLYNAFLMEYLESNQPLPSFYHVSYDQHDLSDEIISEAHKLLSRLEHLKLKKKEAIPFAKLLQAYRNQSLNKGHHVVIIDQARTRVNIEKLNSFDQISKDQLLSYVDHYLDRYADSEIEAKDALENAMNHGFILIASREDEVDGVCVVVDTGFDHFIPSYHLAYIGTNPNSKGRGLGTELIERAVDLTDGSLSLHVDLDNYRAKKLYEKMGFKHVYNRMIFQNED